MSTSPGATDLKPSCMIAGAGPRLGLAIAERFAREGFAAFLLARRPEKLREHVARLVAEGLTLACVACDVREMAAVEFALDIVTRKSSGCEVIVYNAFVDSAS